MKIVSKSLEFTFNDVLLLPQESTFSKEEARKIVSLKTRVTKKLEIDFPLLSSPMPAISGSQMVTAIGKFGGLGIIHCFQGFEDQLRELRSVKKANVKAGVAVYDSTSIGLKHIDNLVKSGADMLSVESYHSFNSEILKFVRTIKQRYGDKVQVSVALMVTAEACRAAIKAGADAVRIGIGGGSHCTTRLVTGIGRPQLSAVAACAAVAHKYKVPLISDTGIQYPGDIVKALAFGADSVMVGGMLAGTDECPGLLVRENGKLFKRSWGMCSKTALTPQSSLGSDSIIGRIKKKIGIKGIINDDKQEQGRILEEGTEGMIPYKGLVLPVLENTRDAIIRSFWYQGMRNIPDLQKAAQVVLVTPNTYVENIARI